MSAAPDLSRGSVGVGAGDMAEQYLTFEINHELFAIPILVVQEIRGWEKVSRIPKTPSHILGVINLRGAVVPVLDLRRRLGISTIDVTATTVVIVVRIPSQTGAAATVGCVVDAVSDVASIAPDEIREAPSVCGSVDSHFICGVSSIDQRLVMILELGRLIEQATSDAPVPDAAPAEAASLFDRIGGTAAVDASVDLFYAKVMSDPSISRFFANTDLEAQNKMQRSFLTLAFGGPNRYSGRGMRAAHAPAVADGLSAVHFDAVIGHLRSTLTELTVPAPLITEVLAIAESVRADVLGR